MLKWLRSFGFGLLAEISTIIVIVVCVTLYRVGGQHSQEDVTAFGERVGQIVGPLGGAIFTYIFARLAVRKVTSNHLAHGIVAALGAIALHIFGLVGAHQEFRVIFAAADLLKLGLGALAGWQTARGNA